jgi:flagellar hook assembly protein FlgD
MKTLKNTFALALTAAVLSFSTVFAADSKRPEAAPSAYKVGMYVSKNAMTLNVMVEKQAGNSVVIRVKDSEGKLLATQTLKGSDERTWSKFNLSELGDGTYNVEVSNGRDVTVKDITLTTPKPIDVNRTIAVQ